MLDPLIRYALLMQLVAAIAGAAILVNTVSYVQDTLQFGKLEYGAVMAAFGISAMLASLGLGSFSPRMNKTMLTRLGAILITLALTSRAGFTVPTSPEAIFGGHSPIS
ncbi:MAG: hypothetical protein VKJ64_12170 [Leptolyngbyaceae bacterium]|nr:hypothetical protein [Leptolyngbyaceae bacterium]